VIAGAYAGLASLINVSRITVGAPLQGAGLELDAIAVVVIGGTSLFGGVGAVGTTLIGAAILSVMDNLLNLLGVSPFSQQIVKGLIILGAVLLERRVPVLTVAGRGAAGPRNEKERARGPRKRRMR
jgi:ribose transport system permease protein